MDDLQQKLSAILGDPKLMQQLGAMAQSLGVQAPPGPEVSPGPDPAMLKGLTGLLGQAAVDRDQQALLSALTPYLTQDKVTRLRKAMQAAGMARAASSFLGAGGLGLLTGSHV